MKVLESVEIPPAPMPPVNMSSSRGLVTSYPFPSLSGSKSSHLIVTEAWTRISRTWRQVVSRPDRQEGSGYSSQVSCEHNDCSCGLELFVSAASVFHIEPILCFFVSLPGVADSGLSNVATLLTNQIVVVLRSRCLVDAVVYDLVSEPRRSSIRLPSWRTWSHRLVVIVRCEGSVVSMLNSYKLWACPSQWYCALTEDNMSL